MIFARIFEAAIVIWSVALCLGLQQASAEFACTGSQLTDTVRLFSQTRFETRDTKPKLARCQSFVKLIREQTQELAGSAPGLASDEIKGVLDEITKILKLRASCPGQPMGGLSSLQEFTDDCQELFGLASGGHASQERNDDETKKLQDSYAEQLEKVKRMADENAAISRARQEQRDQQASQIVELQLENGKLAQKLKELERAQASTSGRADQDKDKVQALQSKNDELAWEAKKSQESLVALRKDNEKLNERQAELARKLQDAQKLSERERAANGELSSKTVQQAVALSELKGKNVELEAKVRGLEATNAKLASELSEAKAKTALQVVPGKSDDDDDTREISVVRGANGKLGLSLQNGIYDSVFVFKVVAGSPAARAGIRFGDQLIAVNGLPVTGRNVHRMLTGNVVKFLVRKSPMARTYVVKLDPECGPCFVWSRQELIVRELKKDKGAAHAGILVGLRLIAVNGQSVLGLDGMEIDHMKWWPGTECTVTFMSTGFFDMLTEQGDLDDIRTENNKILADEKAGRS